MDKQFVTPEERDAEVRRIRSGMLMQEFFIMHRRSVAPERKMAVLLEHFQWIVNLEKAGHILMTGGIFRKDGSQSEGLTILRAPNWEAAEELAASDPVIVAGAVTYYLERFMLGAGRISISIDFSDQGIRLV